MRQILSIVILVAGCVATAVASDELEELVSAFNSSKAPLDSLERSRWEREWRDKLLSAAQGNKSSPQYRMAIRKSCQLSNSLGDIDVSIVLSAELADIYPEDPMMRTQYASLLVTQYNASKNKNPKARVRCLKEIKSSIDALQTSIGNSQSKNRFLKEQVVINYLLLGDMFNERPTDWKLAADAFQQGCDYARSESLSGSGRLTGYDAEAFLSREMNAAISGGDLTRAAKALNELIPQSIRLTSDYYIVMYAQAAFGQDTVLHKEYLNEQLKTLGRPLELGVMLELRRLHMAAQEYRKALPILERIDKEYANDLLTKDARRTELGLHGTYGTVLIDLARVYSNLDMPAKESATWSRFAELFPNDPWTVKAKSRIEEIKQQSKYILGVLPERTYEPWSPWRKTFFWANVVGIVALPVYFAVRLRRAGANP